MKTLLFLTLALPLTGQNLIKNGSFENPSYPNPSIKLTEGVPGWSGIPSVYTGNNGIPWPAAAAHGTQFANAGNDSRIIVSQTFSAPDGLASISWRAMASSAIASGTYQVELKTTPTARPLFSEIFKAFNGGPARSKWNSHSLPLTSNPLPAGNYTFTFQALATNREDFFIDDVIALAPNPGNTSSGAAHTWAANAGWINFLPGENHGVLVTEGYLSRFAYAANFGWVNLGDGSPANGYAYSNTTGQDSGVNLLPNGDLSGLAWSANVGWIKFHAATGSKRARIDLLTGQFHGYAYAANLGWINLGEGNLIAANIHCPDLDNDGLADPWELQYFRTMNVTANSDPDDDGYTNAHEYLALSNPTSANGTPPRSVLTLEPGPFPPLPGQWTMTLPGTPGRVYQIQRSTNLDIWTPDGTKQSTDFPAPLTFYGAKETHPNNDFFFRIAISKPLQE